MAIAVRKKNDMAELYFCLHLTENEHYIVEYDIQQKCQELGCHLKYYRKLKDGHLPMYREIKIEGDQIVLNRLKAWMDEESIGDHIEPNLHRQKCEVCGEKGSYGGAYGTLYGRQILDKNTINSRYKKGKYVNLYFCGECLDTDKAKEIIENETRRIKESI